MGEGVTRWREGDRVTALLGGGGYAEYALVDERHALPVPAGLDFVQAAALPETVFTVWANVFEGGRLQRGETLLVHGANSGIGVTAIQMAKAAGARVFATARGADKGREGAGVGRRPGGGRAAGDWAAAVKAAGAVDVVLDMMGAAYFAPNLDVLAPGGRLVMIAFLTGPVAQLNLAQVMLRRLTITGSTLRARDAAEKAPARARDRGARLAVDRRGCGADSRWTARSRWIAPARRTPSWSRAPSSARSCCCRNEVRSRRASRTARCVRPRGTPAPGWSWSAGRGRRSRSSSRRRGTGSRTSCVRW